MFAHCSCQRELPSHVLPLIPQVGITIQRHKMATVLLLPVLFQTFSFFFFSQHFFTIPTSTQAIVSYANSHALRRVQQCQVAANRPHPSRHRERGETAAPHYRSQSAHHKNKAPLFLAAGHFPKRHFPPPARAALSPPPWHGGEGGEGRVDLLRPTASLKLLYT